jgi:K+/H+ antiporter YhaU regulatory subunit KhtT
MIFNPDADYRFEAADVVIVMGRAEDIAGFRKAFGLAI